MVQDGDGALKRGLGGTVYTERELLGLVAGEGVTASAWVMHHSAGGRRKDAAPEVVLRAR